MKLNTPTVVAAALAAVSVAASVAAYVRLPELVPVHWGPDGAVDGYASRPLFVALLPALMLLVPLLLAFVARRSSRQENLRRSAAAIDAALNCTTLLLFAVHMSMLAFALGVPVDMPKVAASGTAFMLLGIGNVLGKTRSNRLIGIRTRWTLANERVWDRTHRLGGKLLFAEGLIALAAIWLSPATAHVMAAVIAVLTATATGLALYSFVLFRRERSSHA